MGLILGKVTVETPKYEVVAKSQLYEIREYVASLIAEVTYDPSQMKNGRGGGFMILANYIGALGKPNNVKVQAAKEGATGEQGEKIAMTAPVLMKEYTVSAVAEGSEKIAMTAPVLTSQTDSEKSEVAKESGGKKLMTMQFVLPSQYTMDNIPRPTDPRVSVKQLPARKYGVLTFSGVATESITEQKAQELKKALQEAGYNISGDHVLAQYNPPWTIPFLRTNEILIPVE